MSSELCKNIRISKDRTLNNLSLEPENNACSMKEKILNNNNVTIEDNGVIDYQDKFYDFRKIDEGSFCNLFGNEKWHDWFYIPYYYIGNNIDGKYITKLTYGMVKIYETSKKQVELSIGSTYAFNNKFAESNKIEENNFGLRKINVNFNNTKNKYFISQTKYGNFQAGTNLLSMTFFEKKLKSEGEPFKLIAVNEEEWWNTYNNPQRTNFIKNYKESDLIKARQVQELE